MPLAFSASQQRVYHAVKSLLKDDMLKPEYRGLVDSPFCGHCHHASLAIYYLLGGKHSGFKVRKAVDELSIIHYWLERDDGLIMDPTVEQYTDLGRTPPYENRVTKGVSHMISNTTKRLMDEATTYLQQQVTS